VVVLRGRRPQAFERFATCDLIGDAATAERLSVARRAATTIAPAAPDGRIDVTIAHAQLVHLHLWRSEVRAPLRLLVPSTANRQIIYFPAAGRLTAHGRQGLVTCDESHGISLEVMDIQSLVFETERSGIGLSVSRRALARRLSERLDAPLTQRLEFLPCFEAAPGQPSGLIELISAILSDGLSGSLAASNSLAMDLSSLVIDLILQELPHNHSEYLARGTGKIAPWYVKKAVQYINTAGVNCPISISDLANHCGVSVRALQYGFREFVGTSPAAYMRSRKLAYAKEAIEADTLQPLKSIARKAGFSSAARFNKYFAECFGETPSEYKIRLKNS